MTPESIAKHGSEHSHQVALMAWAAVEARNYPELRLMFAIPNGEARSVITGARLRAAGVKAGIPDIFLPAVRPPRSGLFLELKKPGGKTSVDQQRWIMHLNEAGYLAMVCYGWEEAKNVILTYLRY
jgi:hypothetical protein